MTDVKNMTDFNEALSDNSSSEMPYVYKYIFITFTSQKLPCLLCVLTLKDPVLDRDL